jgi:hypothetical protein
MHSPLLLHELAGALAADQIRNAEKARTALAGSATRDADCRGIARLGALHNVCASRMERGVARLGGDFGLAPQR